MGYDYNFEPIYRFSIKASAWFLHNIIHMHSLCLFSIKMGTLESRARLCLDFKDDTAAHRELWLAASVLEIMSSDGIQQIDFWKIKSRLQMPLKQSDPHTFQHHDTQTCSNTLSFVFPHIHQEPKRGPALRVPLWRSLGTTLNPSKGSRRNYPRYFFC